MNHLCKSLGGADIKMLTITENALLNLPFHDHLWMHFKSEQRERYMLKFDIEQRMKNSERINTVKELVKKRLE